MQPKVQHLILAYIINAAAEQEQQAVVGPGRFQIAEAAEGPRLVVGGTEGQNTLVEQGDRLLCPQHSTVWRKIQ